MSLSVYFCLCLFLFLFEIYLQSQGSLSSLQTPQTGKRVPSRPPLSLSLSLFLFLSVSLSLSVYFCFYICFNLPPVTRIPFVSSNSTNRQACSLLATSMLVMVVQAPVDTFSLSPVFNDLTVELVLCPPVKIIK
jgi:hypothetical protein